VREHYFEKRVQAALPQERLLDAYPLFLRSGTPVPPKEDRPVVFETRMPGDAWRAIYANVGKLITGDAFKMSSPSLSGGYTREKAKKKNRPQYGEWTSSAGRVLLGTQPRSRAGVYPTIAITERHLHIVCLQRQRGTIARFGSASHVTASLDRRCISWVRDLGASSHEFGFDDGSWVTLDIPAGSKLFQFFPNVLGKKASTP
jgi:hypothetical protein